VNGSKHSLSIKEKEQCLKPSKQKDVLNASKLNQFPSSINTKKEDFSIIANNVLSEITKNGFKGTKQSICNNENFTKNNTIEQFEVIY